MENWFLIALIAPAFWAVVNLIDVFMVESVYENEIEATIVIGLMQLFPWIAVLLGMHHFSVPPKAYLFFLSGICFTLSMGYFYFKTLFSENDVTMLQIFVNLAVPLTAILSWFFLSEKLLLSHYIGIGIILVGVTLLALPLSEGPFRLPKSFFPMLGSMFFLTLYFFVSRIAYVSSEAQFFDQYLVFSLGGVSVAFLFLMRVGSQFHILTGRLRRLSRKYFFVFLFTELIVMAGTFTSQFALNLSPSASYVAALESLSPLFVIIFSGIFILIRLLQVGKKSTLTELYKKQFSPLPLKILACILTSYGIYLMS